MMISWNEMIEDEKNPFESSIMILKTSVKQTERSEKSSTTSTEPVHHTFDCLYSDIILFLLSF